jgi:uncharacterized membrane protein
VSFGVTEEITMERFAAWAQLVSVMIVGIVAGTFVASQIGQVRVQNTLDAREFTLVKHRFELAMGRIMPVLTVAAGMSMIPVVVAGGSPGIVGLAIAALVLWIAVVVVTLVLNAPVNAAAAHWDPSSPPPNWKAQRDQWHLGQTVRTPLALASFTCLVLASQWNRL